MEVTVWLNKSDVFKCGNSWWWLNKVQHTLDGFKLHWCATFDPFFRNNYFKCSHNFFYALNRKKTLEILIFVCIILWLIKYGIEKSLTTDTVTFIQHSLHHYWFWKWPVFKQWMKNDFVRFMIHFTIASVWHLNLLTKYFVNFLTFHHETMNLTLVLKLILISVSWRLNIV